MSICFITDEAECLPEATLKGKGLFWLTVHHSVGNRGSQSVAPPSQEAELGGKLTFSYLSAPHHRPQSDTAMFRGSTSTSINTGQKITGRHSFPQACLLGPSRARQVDNISHHTTEGGKVKRYTGILGPLASRLPLDLDHFYEVSAIHTQGRTNPRLGWDSTHSIFNSSTRLPKLHLRSQGQD